MSRSGQLPLRDIFLSRISPRLMRNRSLNSLLRICLVCCALVLSVGCGPGSTPVEAPETATTDLIKQNLQMVVESGEMGSEMMSIQGELDKMADENPQKATELREDLQELQGLQGAAAKRKAEEMIEKL